MILFLSMFLCGNEQYFMHHYSQAFIYLSSINNLDFSWNRVILFFHIHWIQLTEAAAEFL